MSSSSYPLDIWLKILVCLPGECLIRFRAVSKGWRAMVDDPCFVRAHTNNNLQQQQLSSSNIIIQTFKPLSSCFSVRLEALIRCSKNGHQAAIAAATPLDSPHGLSLTVVAQCNGLFLTKDRAFLTMWNPFAHERLDLPPSPDFPKYQLSSAAFGLGYDSSTDDYKAVVILKRSRETHVYSLKSDSWRRILDCPAPCDGELWDWGSERGPGVFACGGLNWLSTFKQTGVWEDDKIVDLDLGSEKYSLLQMPHIQSLRFYSLLDVVSGCLALCDRDEWNYLEVWMMRDYGDDDSWNRLFSIDWKQNIYMWRSLLRPVAFVIKEKLVLLQDSYGTFFLFDVETKSFELVGFHEKDSYLYAKQMFVGNIFRLHANCGGGRVRKIETTTTSTNKKKKASADLE